MTERDDDYPTSAETQDALATTIDVSSDELLVTVWLHNQLAETRKDSEFRKSEDAHEKIIGAAEHQPNPCIGPIATPPFYALEIHPGDNGAGAGLVTDPSASVIGEGGEPVRGLYAYGNDMASIMVG